MSFPQGVRKLVPDTDCNTFLSICSSLVKKFHGKRKNEEEASSSSKKNGGPALTRMNELILKKHLQDRAAAGRGDSSDPVKVYSLQETQDRLKERLGVQKTEEEEEEPPEMSPQEIEKREINILYDRFLVQINKELGNAEHDDEVIEKIKEMQKRWDFVKLEVCEHCKAKRSMAPPTVDPATLVCDFCSIAAARGVKRPASTTVHEIHTKRKSTKIEVIVEVHRDADGRTVRSANIQVRPRKRSGAGGGGGANSSAEEEVVPPKVSAATTASQHRAIVVQPDNAGPPVTVHQLKLPANPATQSFDLSGSKQVGSTVQSSSSGGGGSGAGSRVSTSTNSVPGQQQANGALPLQNQQGKQQPPPSSAPSAGFQGEPIPQGVSQHTQQQQQAFQTTMSGANSASEQPKNAYGVAGTRLHPQPLISSAKMETSQRASNSSSNNRLPPQQVATSLQQHQQMLRLAQLPPTQTTPPAGATALAPQRPPVQSTVTTPAAPGTTKVVVSLPSSAGSGPPRPITITPPTSSPQGQTTLVTKASPAAAAATTPGHQPLVLLMQQPNGTVLVHQLPQATASLASPTYRTAAAGQAPGNPLNIISPPLPSDVKPRLVVPATAGTPVQKILSIPATSPPSGQTLTAQPAVKIQQAAIPALKFPAMKTLIQQQQSGTVDVSANQNALLQGLSIVRNNVIHPGQVVMTTKETRIQSHTKPLQLATVGHTISATSITDMQSTLLATGAQSVQIRSPEVAPVSHTGSVRAALTQPPPPPEARATLDDLINAADSLTHVSSCFTS